MRSAKAPGQGAGTRDEGKEVGVVAGEERREDILFEHGNDRLEVLALLWWILEKPRQSLWRGVDAAVEILMAGHAVYEHVDREIADAAHGLGI